VNVTVLVPSTLRSAVDGKQKLDLGVPAGAGVGEVLQTLLTLYPKLRSAMASETRPRRQQLTVVFEPRSMLRGSRDGVRVWLFAAPGSAEPVDADR
jgi:molybdopterin converting factor small subunit